MCCTYETATEGWDRSLCVICASVGSVHLTPRDILGGIVQIMLTEQDYAFCCLY